MSSPSSNSSNNNCVITVQLLEALLSPAASYRHDAEAFLQSLSVAQRTQGWLQALTQQQQSLPAHLQQLAVVLLRRDILLLTDHQQRPLLQQLTVPLLQVFQQSPAHPAAVGDCLAEVCAVWQWVDPAQGRTAMQQMWQAVATRASQADPSALRLLIALAERAPSAFGQVVLASLPDLVARALQQPPAPTTLLLLTQLVVTAAQTTTTTTSAADDSPQPTESTAKILSQLATVNLVPLLQQSSNLTFTSASTLLEHLVQAAEEVPQLLQPILEPLVQFLGHMATTSTVPNVAFAADRPPYYTQLLALQVVGLLGHHATAQQLLLTCLQLVFQACGQLDVEEWASEPASLQQDAGGDDNDDCCEFAQLVLQELLRLCAAAGSSSLHQTVLPTVEQWMTTDSASYWPARRAAMAVLQCTVVALPVSFAHFYRSSIQAALQCLGDQSNHSAASCFRVQYDALVLLALLCETPTAITLLNDLEQHDTTNYLPGRILQSMAQASHSPCPQVAATACLAMVSYCRPQQHTSTTGSDNDEAVSVRVIPYVADVVSALIQGPLKTPGAVSVRAMGALACLAQACGPHFSPYYATVMPGLLACGTRQQQGLDEMGAALQAATLIGQALGEEQKHLFVDDAHRLLQWIVPLLQQPRNDVELDQILWSACARIASVLGEAYAPYVDAVLPHLLQRVTEATDVEIAEGDERGLAATKKQQVVLDEDGMESMTVAVPGRGLTKVTINTSKMQEKALAGRAIYEHAIALGPLFGPYAKASLDALLPLTAFKYSSEIRSISAQTLAAIFEAACAFGEEINTMEIPQMYLPLIANAIATQIEQEDSIDMENVYAQADSLSDILCSVYVRLESHREVLLVKLSLGDAKLIVQHCMASMAACLCRRSQITKRMMEAVSEDEQDECQRLLAHEGELLTPLVDSVGYCLKFFKHAFVPVFETHVAPFLGPYLQAGRDIPARISAVCLFDDCVEHCGSDAAAKFAPVLVEGVLHGMDPTSNGGDENLTRASIYGIAQIARYAPSMVLAPYAQSIINQLVFFATEGSGNPAVTENAVSALASLVLFEGSPFRDTSFIKREEALNMFISALPLQEDRDEARIVHAGLCELIEHSWIQPSSEYEQLIRVIGETLALVADGEEVATQETCIRYAEILAYMQQQVPQDQIHRSFSNLGPEARAAINMAFEQNAHRFANVVSP